MSATVCPRCTLVTNRLSFRKWWVAVCPRCEGCFTEEDDLVSMLRQPDLRLSSLRPALLKNLAPPHSSEEDREPIRCPACQNIMRREHFSDVKTVLIDRCPEGHGIWLDDGELGTLLTTLEEREPPAEPSVWESLRRFFGFVPKIPERESSPLTDS